MAIAFVKNGGVIGSKVAGTASVSLTVPAGGHAAGRLVVLHLGFQTNRSDAVFTVTDSRGNTWALIEAARPIEAPTLGASIYACVLTTALQAGDQITAAVAAPATFTKVGMTSAEFSGASVVESIGSAGGYYAVPDTAVSVGPITPADSATLLIATVQTGGPTGDTLTQDTDTAGGAAWATGLVAGTSGGSAGTNITVRLAYKITTTAVAQTYNPTLGTGRVWVAALASLKPTATGPTVVSRSATLNATGLIATVGRERLARSAALNAAGLVASSGARVTPATQRSAALAATGLIASAGRELLPRSAALNAAGLVAARGIKIRSRSAALAANGSIATVGRETISRPAALSATASIASTGREQLARLAELGVAAQISASGQIESGLVVVSRSAAVSASAGIASVGRELLPRRAVVTATASVTTVGRRRLHRSSAVTAGGQVAVSGEILGAVARSAQVAATGAVATRPQRTLFRSATVSTAPTVAAAGRRTLSRTAAAGAVAAITTTTGKTGQVEFTAIATITLSRYLEPGYLTSTRPGRIAVIYHGQLDVGSLGGLEFPGPDEGELAVGTVGGIARTGG